MVMEGVGVGAVVRAGAGRLNSSSLDAAEVMVRFPSGVLASIEFWLPGEVLSSEGRGRLAGVMAAGSSLSDVILSKFRCVR